MSQSQLCPSGESFLTEWAYNETLSTDVLLKYLSVYCLSVEMFVCRKEEEKN